MAEFVQTMKDWRRMCKTIGRDSCDGCKLHAEGNDCVMVYEGEMDYAQAEKAITEWAAEHPEPIYPTWREWLIKLGIVSFDANFRALLDTRPTTFMNNTVKAYINEEGSKPIPADIAVKLGLEPEEGV